ALILFSACDVFKGAETLRDKRSFLARIMSGDPAPSLSTLQAGTIAVGTDMANDLLTNLVGAGLDDARAQIIVDGALAEVEVAAGTIAVATTLFLNADVSPVEIAAGPLISGAMSSLPS